jgi:uncharacterized membrane protein YqgA involved in biofilm formation
MRVQDLVLLAKKIGVGVAVTAIPAVILVGGLWLTQHSLDTQHPSPASPHTEGSR